MIPKIIHQIWHDHNIPEPHRWPESWKRKNKDWEYKLWTDEELLSLVQDHFPELEELYQSYPNPVQRSDLGRYLILHHCGGFYADLDTECLTPLEEISGETRVILAEEPVEHHALNTLPLGMNRLIFNGVMASPKGHPFWLHVVKTLVRCKNASSYVLESTGPLAFSGAVKSFEQPKSLALHSCHLFSPLTSAGAESAASVYGKYSHLRLSNHYWRGSWFTKNETNWWQAVKGSIRKARYYLIRGPHSNRDSMVENIDQSLLYTPVTHAGNKVAVFIPVRDAERFLERCFELVSQLDYPKDKLRLVFCEGDSVDQTSEMLEKLVDRYREVFGGIEILTYRSGLKLDRRKRWVEKIQYARRSNLAKVRNHLIDRGLKDADWVLWVDADVCEYKPDVLKRLLEESAKVVTPDCVLDWEGPSYDLNAFNDQAQVRDHGYYKHVKRGLFQPPGEYFARRHLHDFRFLERVPLSSVGGTMLLVHANVHRAGIRFSEIPYDDLLETEGFGRMCRDFGVQPIGLPNVQIRHVRS